MSAKSNTDKKSSANPVSRWIAKIMDDCIRIPGTDWRIGVDPLIGLLPGVGDSASAVPSLVIVGQAMRAGVPRLVLIRMMINILLNTAFGALPFVGDLFSAWFKSNRRNIELLERQARTGRKANAGDYLIVACFVAILIALLVGIGFIAYWLVETLYRVASSSQATIACLTVLNKIV